MSDDVCDCGRLIIQPEVGRRRAKCFICSPRDRRDRSDKRASVSQFPVREQPTTDRLTRLTREALDREGVLETWQGGAAIALAELIDAGRHGASGAAGTVKAHREAVQFAIQSAGTDEDDVIIRLFKEN